MTYVGSKFPNIVVDAINHSGEGKRINVLEEAVNQKKKVLLFWWPKDFSALCPTELHAFQEALGEFEKRNTIVVGASCDTNEVHTAWLNTSRDKGGIEGITYDIISDTNRNLSTELGILDVKSFDYDEDSDTEVMEGSYVSYRATYLIDETGSIFHEGVNHMPLARRVGDYLRMIDAFSRLQQHGELCPANWELE